MNKVVYTDEIKKVKLTSYQLKDVANIWYNNEKRNKVRMLSLPFKMNLRVPFLITSFHGS